MILNLRPEIFVNESVSCLGWGHTRTFESIEGIQACVRPEIRVDMKEDRAHTRGLLSWWPSACSRGGTECECPLSATEEHDPWMRIIALSIPSRWTWSWGSASAGPIDRASSRITLSWIPSDHLRPCRGFICSRSQPKNSAACQRILMANRSVSLGSRSALDSVRFYCFRAFQSSL